MHNLYRPKWSPSQNSDSQTERRTVTTRGTHNSVVSVTEQLHSDTEKSRPRTATVRHREKQIQNSYSQTQRRTDPEQLLSDTEKNRPRTATVRHREEQIQSNYCQTQRSRTDPEQLQSDTEKNISKTATVSHREQQSQEAVHIINICQSSPGHGTATVIQREEQSQQAVHIIYIIM